MANLPSLCVLYLDQNFFTGAIPPSYVNLTSLLQLFVVLFKRNNETNTSLSQIIAHRTLSSNPNMHGPIPKDIGNLKKLSMLFLSECGLTGSLPQSLSNMLNLTVLFVVPLSSHTPHEHMLTP